METDQARVSTQNLAFFSVVAAAQLVWGVVSMAEAPRWWLAVGAAGNLVVLAAAISSSPHQSYFVASRRSRQACSQRRQASAQTRQCGMWACRSHSSPQLLQMATQASSSGRATVAS
jgi:hypothetical protein